MDADTAASLAEIINRQLGVRPDAPLARGESVAPEVLWHWVGEAIEAATTRLIMRDMAAE